MMVVRHSSAYWDHLITFPNHVCGSNLGIVTHRYQKVYAYSSPPSQRELLVPSNITQAPLLVHDP